MAHRFRGTFKTWAKEHDYRDDMVGMALAHNSATMLPSATRIPNCGTTSVIAVPRQAVERADDRPRCAPARPVGERAAAEDNIFDQDFGHNGSVPSRFFRVIAGSISFGLFDKSLSGVGVCHDAPISWITAHTRGREVVSASTTRFAAHSSPLLSGPLSGVPRRLPEAYEHGGAVELQATG